MNIKKLIDEQIELHESLGLIPLSINMTYLFHEQFVKELSENIIVKEDNINISVSRYRGIKIRLVFERLPHHYFSIMSKEK